MDDDRREDKKSAFLDDKVIVNERVMQNDMHEKRIGIVYPFNKLLF